MQKEVETKGLQDQVAVAHLTMQHSAALAAESDLFRSASDSAVEAYKASLLINGGAAVALLAMAGHALTIPGGPAVVRDLVRPLACFVVGTLCAAVTTGAAYVASAAIPAAASDPNIGFWRRRIHAKRPARRRRPAVF